MEKLENSEHGILSTLLLSVQEEGKELSLTHSLTHQTLATYFHIPGPTTVVGGDELSKASSTQKNTRAKQNLVEMSGSTKAPTRHYNWMTKRRGKGCSGLA